MADHSFGPTGEVGPFTGNRSRRRRVSSGEGGKKGPSLRAPEVQNARPGAIFWLLTNGVVRKGMPVWSRLPEPQRWQLVRYLKSLGIAEPAPTATATPAPGKS